MTSLPPGYEIFPPDDIFPIAGTPAMMDYANAGNFGVGVTPTESLQVIGNIRIPTTTAAAGIIKQEANRLLHTYGQSGCVFLGENAGNLTNTAIGDIGIGKATLPLLTTGSGNVVIGYYGAPKITTSAYNIVIGTGAGTNLDANGNVMIGKDAGFTNNVAYGIYLGYEAGYYETGSGKLFIDNVRRASEADGRLRSLIYGIFAAAVPDQRLTFNAGWMGFFGTAAIAQPTTAGAAGAFVVNAGTAVNDASTFDGYTLLQVVRALRLLGLLT